MKFSTSTPSASSSSALPQAPTCIPSSRPYPPQPSTYNDIKCDVSITPPSNFPMKPKLVLTRNLDECLTVALLIRQMKSRQLIIDRPATTTMRAVTAQSKMESALFTRLQVIVHRSRSTVSCLIRPGRHSYGLTPPATPHRHPVLR